MKANLTSFTVVMICGLHLPLYAQNGDRPQKQANLRDGFFSNHTIPNLRIQLEPAAIAALRNRPRDYVKATVYEETNTYRDVGMHLKGQYGTFQGLDGKPSITLNFDKFKEGQRFYGLDKLHLNNSVQDPSYLCELLGRKLCSIAELPTGRASHARVELNGRDLGLFVLIEGYDREFLKRHFVSADGNLYDSEFRHDISDPLKRSSGNGVNDHADLQELVAASAEPNHRERLARLSGLLDLERFYAMLALENLVRHHDGYSMGINNYRIYFDSTIGRATILPGGLDQLFFAPRASLLPDLKGSLADAVLETQGGRKAFRANCVTLFTNVFPVLSNYVERVRMKIRPILTKLDCDTARRADESATNLLYRIQLRTQQLKCAALMSPEPPAFDSAGAARLTNWMATVEGDHAVMAEAASGGDRVLEVQLDGTSRPTLARWEKPVQLSAGGYCFSARVTAEQPVFRGPTPPVALRLWGEHEVNSESSRLDSQAMELRCTFQVYIDKAGEYVLQCEARGCDTTVVYKFSDIKLTRIYLP